MNESSAFPWGSNRPTRFQRIAVATVIGCIATAMHYSGTGNNGGLSDFSILWHGSRALLTGSDPYLVIGPNRPVNLPSPVFYPAPALVAAAPFIVFPMRVAGAVFVFVSAWLLAFGVTRTGWQLLPIFPSVAFMTSSRLGQWSTIIAASLYIPVLASLAVVKPQASLPILSASTRWRTYLYAAIGGVVLTAIAFALLPGWPASWMSSLGSTDYFRPPLSTIAGALIALVLLRWRRPEAWLVFTAACLPQTWYPYNGLILLTVARTYREASVLSLVSSMGWLAAYAWFIGEWRSAETRVVMQNVLIAFGYLPAVIAILRRPNEGPNPVWMSWLLRKRAVRVASQ